MPLPLLTAGPLPWVNSSSEPRCKCTKQTEHQIRICELDEKRPTGDEQGQSTGFPETASEYKGRWRVGKRGKRSGQADARTRVAREADSFSWIGKRVS